jgi:xanthine dehydrogenase accessory factor
VDHRRIAPRDRGERDYAGGRLGGSLPARPVALVKGAGDLATGVALGLARAGWAVVMTETAQPTVVRRTVALAEAVFRGRTTVEGLDGVLAREEEVAGLLAQGAVPVLIDPQARFRLRLEPELLVDAIMAKRNLGTCITDAPLVVGLGPGFVAGRDVHAVVETQRGPTLGCVLTEGCALPDTGTPAQRNGAARERILRSPAAGVFRPASEIGDLVQEGQAVGFVDDAQVVSPLNGALRGLLHGGLQVTVGFKLGDVDPGATREDCHLVSDKARAVGRGVLDAAAAAGLSGRFSTLSAR